MFTQIIGGLIITVACLYVFMYFRLQIKKINIEKEKALCVIEREKEIDKNIKYHLEVASEMTLNTSQTIEDIIQAKYNAEKKLRNSERQYKSIVNGQLEMIVRFSIPDKIITFANDTFCKRFKTDIDNIIRIDELYTHSTYEFQDIENELRSGKENVIIEDKIYDDGKIIWVQWYYSFINFDDYYEIQGVGRNITEKKNAEHELKSELKKLDALNKLIAINNRATDLQDAINDIHRTVKKLFSFESCGIFLIEEDQSCVINFCKGNYKNTFDYIDATGDEFLEVISTMTVKILDHSNRLCIDNNLKQCIISPIIEDKKVVGFLIGAYYVENIYDFDDNDKCLIMSISNEISNIIKFLKIQSALEDNYMKMIDLNVKYNTILKNIPDIIFVVQNDVCIEILETPGITTNKNNFNKEYFLDKNINEIIIDIKNDDQVISHTIDPRWKEVIIDGRWYIMNIVDLNDFNDSSLFILRDVTELKYHANLLKVISEASNILITITPRDEAINTTLEKVGKFMNNIDRIYIFRNHMDLEKNEWACSQLYEWCSGDVSKEIDNTNLQVLLYKDICTDNSFFDTLFNGNFWEVNVDELDENIYPSKPLLQSQSIKSMKIFPIICNNSFIGYIGFDVCKNNDHVWTIEEDAALQLLASNLGSILTYRSL